MTAASLNQQGRLAGEQTDRQEKSRRTAEIGRMGRQSDRKEMMKEVKAHGKTKVRKGRQEDQ